MPPFLTRRDVICGIGAGFASALACSHQSTSAPFRSPSLAKAAQKAGLIFGASASKEIFENPSYAALYRHHAKLITTDVALKFDYIRATEHQWDFGEADKLLAFAQQNDMQLRGHTLIWNENAPDWLKRRSASQIEYVFEQHIDKVAGRYAGQLHSWDVINEPFWPGHGKKGGYRTGPWFEALGSSYVKRAFKRAALADPRTPLVLNEAHCERDDQIGKKIRASMLRLIDELLDAGIALDGVGLQAHLQPSKKYNDQVFTDFLWKLHERGLNIHISEFDIDDSPYPHKIPTRDKLVARRAHQFLSKVLQVPSVKSVICWQLADRYSWYTNMAKQDNPATKRLPRPLPFDDRLRPKPFHEAMIRAFRERRLI